MITLIKYSSELNILKELCIIDNNKKSSRTQKELSISDSAERQNKSGYEDSKVIRKHIINREMLEKEDTKTSQRQVLLKQLQAAAEQKDFETTVTQSRATALLNLLHHHQNNAAGAGQGSRVNTVIDANLRQIDDLMNQFYHPLIHQQSDLHIQEKFDLLRFETDLLSLKDSDNAWGRDLAEKHWEAIGAARDNYLEVFLKAFEKMNAFYADFVTLKNSLNRFIGSANDKGEIHFLGEGFREEIDKLLAKYAAPSDVGQLFPEAGKTATQEECERWIKQMGLPAGSLDSTGGQFTVRVDLSAIEKMKEGLNTGWWSANRLSAWESGFNAQGDILQNMLQMFTQKMTSANSLYDNLVKIFSSFIEQDLSAAKGYFNF